MGPRGVNLETGAGLSLLIPTEFHSELVILSTQRHLSCGKQRVGSKGPP